MKKILSVILVLSMLCGLTIPAFAVNNVSYTITNPYDTVDWSWTQYKAQLHAHTLYSDGEMDITDVVESYYALDYDILAITDHGVVNQGWDKVPEMLDLIGYNQYIKNLKPLDSERYQEIINGTDRDGRGMLDVQQGIEMNGVVMRKNHVNGFFCGWGQGEWGKEEDYITPVAETEKAGGISFINHPGDFFAANVNVERVDEPENLRTFTEVFMNYESCVGTEVFNGADTAARYDRMVWDNILMYTIPRGRNVWGFANDDSHNPTEIGRTAQMMLMPENTNEALRTAMENGTFFSCSILARDEMGENFTGNGNFAKVTYIDVDDVNDIITVTAENADVIEWVADGEVIATGASIDLNDYANQIGSYVRFQIKNEGGILLSQPFVCNDGDMSDEMVYYPEEINPDELDFITKFVYELWEFLRKTLIGELLYRFIVLNNF